jgi:hypothetical protein
MLSPKLQIPVFAALLFIVVSSPDVYRFTNDTLGEPLLKMKTVVAGGAPSKFGLILHAIVFFALMYVFNTAARR